MARVLGVDFGTKRIGLAVSDPEGITAQPLEVLEASSTEEAASAVAERARELGVDALVVGIPLRMSGVRGPAAEAAEVFAQLVEAKTGLPVHRWDERLSTREAEGAMRAAGVRARRQRGTVDKVAAALVLRAYLEAQRGS
jgi:putative Holliday junction resolvase